MDGDPKIESRADTMPADSGASPREGSDGANGQGDTNGDARPILLEERDPNRYHVIAEHGRGGVGRVLRATDLAFGRDVALKELLQRTPRSEARFVREAIITSRLEHPNIVPVHEAGRWPDGTPYYAMKLVSGRPLESLIAEARTYADRRALLGHLLAATDAIAYAHDRGVIHRDIKPSNIIIGAYGETIVIDWGLAKYVSDPDDEDGDSVESGPRSPPLELDLTRTGTVLGTPAYMAPEQALAGEVTERTDVYALGAILLDVIAGRALTATSTGSPARQATTRVGWPDDGAMPREVAPRVPADLRSIVRQAMALSPVERYANAKELGDDIRRFLAGKPVAAHRYTRRERAARWLGSHRRLAQGSAAVLVGLLAASVWFLAREARLRSDAEVARQTADQARHTAESERDRADRQTIALLEQQGRAELDAGSPFRAAPILAEAYRRDPGNLRVRWLLTDALRALDSLTSTFNVLTPGPNPNQPVDWTYSVSLSADDSELMTGHLHGIGYWDPTTGALRRRLPLPWTGHLARHGRDGQVLLQVGGGGDTAARIVDGATGKELVGVPTGEDADWTTWSSDGRYLASVNHAGRVDLWSAAPRPARRFSFSGAPQPVFGSLAISPDASVLAARGVAEVILASPETGALRHLALPGDDVQQLVFSPDSRLLMTSLADRSIRIWDVAAGQPLRKLRPHVSHPLIAVFSADGSTIASADKSSLYLWDASSTVLLARFDFQSRDQPISGVFAHRAPRLVTIGFNGQVRTWDVPRDRWAVPLPEQHGRLRAAYLAGGDAILTADEGRDGRARLRIWNAKSGEVESSSSADWDPECNLAVTADGDRIALLGPDGRPRIVDASSGNVRLVIDTRDELIRGLSFSPDGRRLAAASENGSLYVWSADTGAASLTLPDPDKRALMSVAFSPDGNRLLVGGHQAPTRVRDASTGKILLELPDSVSTLVAYSRDGRRMITSGTAGDVVPRVWDSVTGTLVTALETQGAVILSVTFSPDGALIATAEEAGKASIWDAETGAELRSIGGPTEARMLSQQVTPTGSALFSPDGKRLLVTGMSYALIWNVELDARRPAEVDAVVATKSPWRLVDGRLSRRVR